MEKKLEIFREFIKNMDSLHDKAKTVKEYLDFMVKEVKYKGGIFRFYEKIYDPDEHYFNLYAKLKTYYDGNGILRSFDSEHVKIYDDSGEIFAFAMYVVNTVMEYETSNGEKRYLIGANGGVLEIPEAVFLHFWRQCPYSYVSAEELADVMCGNLLYPMWVELLQDLGKD